MFNTPEHLHQQIDSELDEVLNRPPQLDDDRRPYAAELFRAEVDSSVESAMPDADSALLDTEQPPKGIDGDVAVAMFPLARTLRKSPAVIAQAVADHMQTTGSSGHVDTVQAVGPYLNVTMDRGNTFAGVMSDVVREGSHAYGHNSDSAGEKHVIDYSGPNTAKKLGIQHLPTTVIGESLARISEANGATPVRINHLGDFGTPFGKVLLGVEKFGFDFSSDDPVGQMHELYVRINAMAKNDKQVADAAREKFQRLEQGDPELVSLWSRLRELNVDENEALYRELGIKFDTTIGESYYVAPAQSITDNLVTAGIAQVDGTGAVFVPGETVMEQLDDGRQIGNVLLRKSDGSTLYAARDLAAIEHRVRTFDPSMIEYVVGSEQSEHFAAVFAIAGLAGIAKPHTQLVHTKIGMLLGASGKKLSSRDGGTRLMADIMEHEYQRSLEFIQERGTVTDPAEQRALARNIANAAIGYPLLKKDPGANTAFRDDSQQTPEAREAGHLQYTHARAMHILGSEDAPPVEAMRDARYDAVTDTEWRLIRAVMEYPVAVREAGQERSPSHVAKSVADVASAFNAFYEANPIRSEADHHRRVARYALTLAAQTTMKSGFRLLNIKAPDRM